MYAEKSQVIWLDLVCGRRSECQLEEVGAAQVWECVFSPVCVAVVAIGFVGKLEKVTADRQES